MEFKCRGNFVAWKMFLILVSASFVCACGGGGDGTTVENDDQTITGDRGMTIYVAGFHPQQPELGGVAAINGSSGAVTRLIRSAGDFQDISVSTDGRYVIFSEYNSCAIYFYEVDTSSLLQGQTKAGAFGVAITSDSAYSLVVSTNVDPTLALCDLIALETINGKCFVESNIGSASNAHVRIGKWIMRT